MEDLPMIMLGIFSSFSTRLSGECVCNQKNVKFNGIGRMMLVGVLLMRKNF